VIDKSKRRLERGPALQPGEVIAPGYEVIEHLRRGKRLDVYDVWSIERTCRCIAKTITPDRLDEEKARIKLIDEAELLMSLTHPNIVRAYELVENAVGTPVLILETLTGRTVSHLIDEFEDGMDLPDVIWLGLHLCSAVAYLHRHGCLHLDVKPDNVISDGGRARLIDLSISGSEGGPSAAGAGTYDYLAPEQARGDNVSAATDVWGIGITLYEALTGTVPFEPDDDGDEGGDDDAGSSSNDYGDSSDYTDASDDYDPDVYPQTTERAPSVATRRDGLPNAIVEIVDACLEPAQADRPSVEELAGGLARVSGLDPRETL
jgi:serine/threonine protein kinase